MNKPRPTDDPSDIYGAVLNLPLLNELNDKMIIIVHISYTQSNQNSCAQRGVQRPQVIPKQSINPKKTDSQRLWKSLSSGRSICNKALFVWKEPPWLG